MRPNLFLFFGCCAAEEFESRCGLRSAVGVTALWGCLLSREEVSQFRYQHYDTRDEDREFDCARDLIALCTGTKSMVRS